MGRSNKQRSSLIAKILIGGAFLFLFAMVILFLSQRQPVESPIRIGLPSVLVDTVIEIIPPAGKETIVETREKGINPKPFAKGSYAYEKNDF